MTNSNYTHISILVDRSGSMQSIKDDAQGGINNLIKEQKEVPGKLTIGLYDFDTEYRTVFAPVDVEFAPNYSLEPRGLTALNDSMHKAIVDTGTFLNSLPEDKRPGKVIFAVFTDGGENASKEVQLSTVKESIEHQQKNYNWEFFFGAANIDAFGTGSAYSFSSSTQYAATGASTRAVYSSLNASLTNSRLTGATLASAMPSEIDEEGNATWNNTTSNVSSS